nr:immunoglobulin heavy chain junction region [Macaca mulatta]
CARHHIVGATDYFDYW